FFDSFFIFLVIYTFYYACNYIYIISAILKGMEARVAASIVDLIIDMMQGILKEENLLFTLMALITFIASFVFNVNVLVLIISCALLAIAQTYLKNTMRGA